MQPKILLFDEETAPSLGRFFDLWKEGNIVWTVKEWFMLSVAYKWLGEKQVKCLALPDFKGYKPGSEDDKKLIFAIWKLFDEADVLVAHNGDRFDVKKANARFAYYKLPPPSPYKTVDTFKIAKKYFGFTSNKLDSLAEYLGYGRKLTHTGSHLWKSCMAGDMKAWKHMIQYNKRDVVLLELIYLHFLPWATNHPNVSVMAGTEDGCPNCKSTDLVQRGYGYTKTGRHKRYRCRACQRWSQGQTEKVTSIT